MHEACFTQLQLSMQIANVSQNKTSSDTMYLQSKYDFIVMSLLWQSVRWAKGQRIIDMSWLSRQMTRMLIWINVTAVERGWRIGQFV
jgi:hypothetical protein